MIDYFSSFSAFHRHWMPPLTGYLRAQTSDVRWVEIIARESMLAARRRWSEVAGCGEPGVWLLRMATTLLRRWQQEADAPSTPLDGMVTGDERSDLLNAVRSLPRRQREALALHCLLEMPMPEVAGILGTGEGSARALVHRARVRLAELLGPSSPTGARAAPAPPGSVTVVAATAARPVRAGGLIGAASGRGPV